MEANQFLGFSNRHQFPAPVSRSPNMKYLCRVRTSEPAVMQHISATEFVRSAIRSSSLSTLCWPSSGWEIRRYCRCPGREVVDTMAVLVISEEYNLYS